MQILGSQFRGSAPRELVSPLCLTADGHAVHVILTLLVMFCVQGRQQITQIVVQARVTCEIEMSIKDVE